MLYTNLSTEDKEILSAFERNARGWMNALAALLIQARALEASYNAPGGAKAIRDTLDVGEKVLNTSGMPGAQSLPLTDWDALMAALAAYTTAYDTLATRKRIAQAVGPLAGI